MKSVRGCESPCGLIALLLKVAHLWEPLGEQTVAIDFHQLSVWVPASGEDALGLTHTCERAMQGQYKTIYVS